jgi:hypothetical protein
MLLTACVVTCRGVALLAVDAIDRRQPGSLQDWQQLHTRQRLSKLTVLC